MSLFVVQHKHEAAMCPAANPEVAPQLLKLLASAPQQGVTILAEAVVDAGHELDLIVDAPTAARWTASWARSARWARSRSGQRPTARR